MRPLAIARFRLWTTIRAASPLAFFGAVPGLMALFIDTSLSFSLQMAPDTLMRIAASAAVLSWSVHGFILIGIAHELGQRRVSPDASVHPADLIDSAPISPAQRSAGEFAGILTTMLLLHAVCLPVLTIVAALSPLPSTFFAWFEGALLALIVLAAASAAWRLIVLAPFENNNIRAVQNAGLFFLLLMIIAIGTTRPIAFRDGFFQFLFGPSVPAWSRFVATIEYPAAMIGMFLSLYCGYLAFYALSAFGRTPQE